MIIMSEQGHVYVCIIDMPMKSNELKFLKFIHLHTSMKNPVFLSTNRGTCMQNPAFTIYSQC